LRKHISGAVSLSRQGDLGLSGHTRPGWL
jgi:hypothetical protein